MSNGADSFTRRQALKSVGVLAGAATVGGGHVLSQSSPDVPQAVDAWPPETDASTVVTGDYYDEWSDWAAVAFSERTGIDVQTYSAGSWEPRRSWGGRTRPPGLLRTAFEQAKGLFTEPSPVSEPAQTYDTVTATTEFLGAAVEDDLLEPLPTSDVPAFDRVHDVFQSIPVHRVGDSVYGLPVEVELTPLVYNADYFDDAPDSWGVLWDEAHAGDVLVETDVTYGHPQIAALYAGEDPRDPNFDRLETVLERQQPFLVDGHQDVDAAEAVDRFAGEEAVVGSLSLPAVYEARSERDVPLEYAVPSEGSVVNCLFSVVPRASRRPVAGLRYANWLSRPAVAAKRWELERAVPTVSLGEHAPAGLADFLAWADEGQFVATPDVVGTRSVVGEYRKLMNRLEEDDA